MVLYYLFILPISKLPRWILYGISDVLYFILYKCIKYRANVVLDNMQRSFPDKTAKEIKAYMNAFYAHFCDVVVETIEGFSVTNDELRQRVVCTGHEHMTRYLQQGKSLVVVGGHYNNWEVSALAMPLYIPFPCIGIYKPLKNKFLDQKLKDSRQKSGLTFIATHEVGEYMQKNASIPAVYFFLTDQSPSNPKNAYWVRFLNQETAVLKGAEKYARQFELPIFYGEILKTARGNYSVSMDLMATPPHTQGEGVLTAMHTHRLEKTIQAGPSNWLWTHKRWKHKKTHAA